MSELSIVCLGDAHLDGLPSCLPAKLAATAHDRVFDQVEKYCLDNGISTIIQLGDVCDNPRFTQDAECRFAQRMLTTKLHWHIMKGNHDYESATANSLLLFDILARYNVFHNCKFYLSSRVVNLDNMDCVFLPWPQRSHPRIQRRKAALVFAHIPIEGAVSESGHRLKGKKYQQEFGHNKFWVLGDIHNPQEGSDWLYVGAMLPLNFSDTNNRRFIELNAKIKNDKLKVEYKSIPITLPYNLHSFTANELSELPDFTKFRPGFDFIKIKAGPAVLAVQAELSNKYRGLVIEPLKYKGSSTITDGVVTKIINLENSFEQRREFLRQNLRKCGLSKREIKIALSMAEQTEKQVLSDIWKKSKQ